MSGPHNATRTGRFHGDEGAVIIEAALVLPVLVTFALGMLEFGYAFHERLIVDRGMTLTGRRVSQLATNRFADFEALRSIDAWSKSLGRSDIQKVIIYRSTTPDGAVPADCLAVEPTGSTAGVNGLCNVYSASQVQTQSVVGFPGTTNCSTGWDANWCPVNRNRGTNLVLPDFIGVYVEVDYQGLTGLVETNLEIKRNVVFAIEPEAVGTG